MYNLVWQWVMCRPGKLLILLVRKNQNAAPNRSDRQTTTVCPLGKTRPPGASLTSIGLRPPSVSRWPLILIVARQEGAPIAREHARNG
jgi:hypothetical protein